MEVIKVIQDELNNLLEIKTEDGYTVEAVHYRGNTLCVSSQVGCSIRCTFCASGMNGFIRNLSFQEIVDQYRLVVESGYEVKNITFAGIGEPLLNWQNVKTSFEYFKSLGLKVSFYTTGFPILYFRQLLDINHNGVTLSIHSVYDEKRKSIIPNSQKVEELLEILEEHIKNLSSRKKKLYSLGYLLIKDINDSEKEIEELIRISKRLSLSVSLLKYNEVEGIPYKTTPDKEYEAIFLKLRECDIKTTLSNRYRTRKIGGCGTLMINRLNYTTL
ncbi:MAG: radical SAM protein [Hydrogenothermaceae bacterium]|nr:radical SAM protein [Hydrogenothermaceae bacterium]